MSPLSAIPHQAIHAYGLKSRAALAPAEVSPLPGQLDMPAGIAPTQPAGDSFATMLGNFVADVNARQNVAADAVNRLQAGGQVSLHQAVIAMEEANVSFQLMVEVRNKLLESYQELMRMQV
jgi:flagellar hook-basal body complex protein FliE